MHLRRLEPWLSVSVYAALIFYFSCLPGECVVQPFPWSDKAFHLLEYFPFGFLLFRAFSKAFGASAGKTLLLAVFVIMLYALSDEIHQLATEGRTFSIFDLFCDVAGALAGGLIYSWRR